MSSLNQESAARCQAWASWILAKWRELDRNRSLGAIEDAETGWVADWRDKSANCPYCGYTVKRPR